MTSGNECGGPMIGPVGSGDSGSLYAEDLVGSTTEIPSGECRAGNSPRRGHDDHV